MKKVYIMLFAVCVAFTFGACNEGNKHKNIRDHHQATEELLKISRIDSLLDKSIDQMLDMQIRQNPTLTPYRSVLQNFFRKYMSYESLKPEIIKIYSENLSVKELNDIIAFYKTPTGQKTIEVMPQIMQQSMQLGSSKVQKHLPELQQEIEKAMLKSMPRQK
jgi:hypothetical protein